MSYNQSTTRPVEFLSDGLIIRGHLRLPSGNGPHPIVILGHGLSALKEWTMPDVAVSLAEAGIAGLWFDYRNFGDSEGLPREEVSHYGRLEDWKSAISYASSLYEINPERIGVWGTSLGGRDVLALAAIDSRIKAVLAQTPLIKWFPQLASRMAGYADNVDQFQQDLAEDHRNRVLGKEPRYISFVKPTGDEVKQSFLDQLNEEELRNYKGKLTLQSYQATTLTDVTPLVALIAPRPVCFILADQDFLPGQMEAYDATREPKTLVEIEGHHFSPYMEQKTRAIEVAREFFQAHFRES